MGLCFLGAFLSAADKCVIPWTRLILRTGLTPWQTHSVARLGCSHLAITNKSCNEHLPQISLCGRTFSFIFNKHQRVELPSHMKNIPCDF